MTEQERTFEFIRDAGYGTAVVVGPTGAGKSVPSELVKLWESGHPGGILSIGQAGFVDAQNRKAKRQVGKRK
jgi:ABC-type arginine transport system ATPase subunit